MEAGINADQNFYRRQFPPTSDDGQVRHPYEAAQPANYDPRPPQLPPKVSLLTSNLQTNVANGFGTGESSPAPDDFYRGYRGLQSSQGYSESATDGIMTATSAIAGSRQPSSSSRSNSNGTTPKHPSTSASRVALRPSYRSASAPIDERIPLSTAKSTPALKSSKPQQASVKDLLKRFDQNNEQTSTASRKPVTRLPMGENGIGGPTYMKSRGSIPSQPAGASVRAGQMTRETSSTTGKTFGGSRITQRSRFAPEDQQSNNTLSSVPRTVRTRHDISGNTQASQSMTNLSPAVPPKTSTQALARKPLFGEVVPEESGPPNVGFGITESRARRTSDPSLDQPAWRHQRSQSDADVAPPSPTAWYRGATPLLEEPSSKSLARPSRQHGRAQSDFTGGKLSPAHGNTSAKRNAHKSPPADSKILLQSRLPVHSRRSSTPSEAASSSSQRSISPSQSKTQKSDPRPWSPAGRSKTPTHRYTRSPGRLESSPGKNSTSNASLKAYISAPLPKTSPPLRSSRPRLPVSTATTASSRGKVADRSGSPQPHSRHKNSRSGNKDAKSTSRIGVPGPVDFAASRERIQRAYSKSIQESEAKELRAAVERRLKAIAQDADVGEQPDETMSMKDDTQNVQAETAPAENNNQSPKLELQTTFLSPKQAYTGLHRQEDSSALDSPTLGIPGSFPTATVDSDDEEPQSAVSNATGVTEFDNEPQTEPPRHNHTISHDNNTADDVSADALPRTLSVDSSLLMTNDNGSIQIILDTTSIDEAKDLAEDNQNIELKDAYEHELASERQPYGEPVFVSTTSMPMIDMETPSTLLETPRQPDGFDYKPENIPANDITGRDYVNDTRRSTYNQEHMDKLPQPEFRLYTSSSPALPMINTKLDEHSTSDFLTTPVTEIDYESSDGVDEPMTSSNGPTDTVTAEFSTHRASQQSAWTDYTVNTNAASSWQWANNHTPLLPDFSNSTEPPQPPPKEEYAKPDVPPKPPNYSPLPSPRSVGTTPRMTAPAYAFRHDYSASLENLGSETTRVPLHDVPSIPPIPAWPDHSPPPPPAQGVFSETITPQTSRSPPPASLYNRRPVSSVYRSTRDSESRRESVDDFTSSRPSISTPISSARISLNEEPAPSQQSFIEPPKLVTPAPENKELTEKETKRLYHRANVIKELIDTESVYLKDMNVVEEIYKGTAEACPKLEITDVKTIFRNTDQIVAFSTMFLDELKAASASVYSPRQKLRQSRTAPTSPADERLSTSATLVEESDYEKDRRTRVGEHFGRHIKDMQIVYTDFLKSSEQASTRLAALQADPAVKTWLTECNTEAKGLTAAWDLDALLIKPVQRITRYQLLLNQLLEATPVDHPDHRHLQSTFREIGGLLKSIDDLKKRIDTVNKIVGRKRKESDVRLGLARAFGVKTRDKTSSSNRPADDEAYMKSHERFGDDYLRLQVVLRDVEFYTRQANTYVNDFLRYLSAIELVMRVSASPYPELESKWARFNMSMRDMGSVALEDHVSAVRKQVIEPFEHVIKAYGPPDLAMKKRKKRRLDYEKYLVLKAGNKKVDEKLAELVEQYEALNETLKFELPKLSALTEQIGRMCLIRFVSIQVEWFGIWQQKVKTVLEESQMPKDIADIIDKFHRDYKYQQARIQELGIANGAFLQDSPKGRNSQSTATRDDSSSIKSKNIPPPLNRPRVHSISSDHMPSLPTPDFVRRLSEQFTLSPLVSTGPGLPSFSTRDFPPVNGYSRPESGSPAVPDFAMNSRPQSTRPNTSRSFDSGGPARRSVESGEPAKSPSSSAYYSASQQMDSLPASARPFSGLFHSAMPVSDEYEESQRSSRASSRERDRSGGYNILYLAASLFEFNISTTKSEAGYPYLTYQAGEIFDVIGEKGELWLAKNQDDPTNRVGWIWSKHFARLADD